MNRFTLIALLAILALLSSCSQFQYYLQSATGHFAILKQTATIDELLESDDLDEKLRSKLVLVREARAFAAERLALPDNGSYTRYADLKRDYVLQSLFAAPEFSTQLYSWCYIYLGCANYRGYFDEDMLAAEKSRLEGRGIETHVAQVTAYSTLGWFDDPALNTFVSLPDYRLVGLIFHELAHQAVYLKGDTFFNESFATAVEHAGVALFYSGEDGRKQRERYHHYLSLNQSLTSLITSARNELDRIYAQPDVENISTAQLRDEKSRVLTQLQQDYMALVREAAGDRSKTATTPVTFNNAKLGASAAYHRHVAAFGNIIQSHSGDFAAAYAHVHEIGQLKEQERVSCLLWWSTQDREAALDKIRNCR